MITLKPFCEPTQKEYLSIPTERLEQIASDPRPLMRGFIERHPNTPPLVRLWLKTYRESGMTLQEFLEATHEKVRVAERAE